LIAAWLSEGGDIESSGHDTTIDIQSPISNAGKESPAPTEKPASPPENPLKTVRDRAQEIIRRYNKEHPKG
jgi:hypothetical protein